MVNKVDGVFSKSDEEAFQTFAVYCGLALHHAKVSHVETFATQPRIHNHSDSPSSDLCCVYFRPSPTYFRTHVVRLIAVVREDSQVGAEVQGCARDVDVPRADVGRRSGAHPRTARAGSVALPHNVCRDTSSPKNIINDLHVRFIINYRYEFSPWSFGHDEKIVCVIKMFKDLYNYSK